MNGSGHSKLHPAATLRDQFAMAAMTGLLANHLLNDVPYEGIADTAYEMADYILTAREVQSDD